MLVLSRKAGERIAIGDGISVVVNRISGNRVAIGIDAPDEMKILRGELLEVVESFHKHDGQLPEDRQHDASPPAPRLELGVGDGSYSPNNAR